MKPVSARRIFGRSPGVAIPGLPLRTAFSLLEIVLSLALFFGSAAILGQLAWNSSRAAIQSRLKSQAILRCESKMSEIIVGAESLTGSGSDTPFADDPNWTWRVDTQTDTRFAQLLHVRVTVTHDGTSSLARVSQSLQRWMRDPQVYVDAAYQKELLAAEAAAASSGSDTGSNTGGSQ